MNQNLLILVLQIWCLCVSVDILTFPLVLSGCGDLGPGPVLHLVTAEHEVQTRASDVDTSADPEHSAPLRHLQSNILLK